MVMLVLGILRQQNNSMIEICDEEACTSIRAIVKQVVSSFLLNSNCSTSLSFIIRSFSSIISLVMSKVRTVIGRRFCHLLELGFGTTCL